MPSSSKQRVRLRPADAFDLIRLIARSQSDPKKAVAELVQNSLDAGARNIKITWANQHGARAIAVWDDGCGIFPEVGREEALQRLASTIGQSHKRQLTPAERHRQMTLGKYGIGLLGFWSVGRVMEIRTRVGSSPVHVLTLEEEVRDGTIAKARAARLPLEETFTEIVITRVHAEAQNQLKPRRLAAYLAGEMRGQLLRRSVRLEIHDRIARGRAQKLLLVRPRRYQGAPIREWTELPVAGFAAARVELYLVPESEARHGQVQLACGGATVIDDLALLDGPEEPRAPWSLGRFEGVIDFPDLEVAPATRRGFVPNAAARALMDALPALEAACREVLDADAERRRTEQDAEDAKDLRRLFRRLPGLLPQYALFSVKDDGAVHADPERGPSSPGEPTADSGLAADVVPVEPVEPVEVEAAAAETFLYPPGPLATVEMKPKRAVLVLEEERAVKAEARDADGRALNADAVEYQWSLAGAGTLAAEGPRASYRAPDRPCVVRVRVVAIQDGRSAEAEAALRVLDDLDPRDQGDQGVPDPIPVEAPGENWRSRVLDGVWQYNTGHQDYRTVQADAKSRLRYLVQLFAKEIVLRNFGSPADAPLLERMVEVLTHVTPAGQPGPSGSPGRRGRRPPEQTKSG